MLSSQADNEVNRYQGRLLVISQANYGSYKETNDQKECFSLSQVIVRNL